MNVRNRISSIPCWEFVGLTGTASMGHVDVHLSITVHAGFVAAAIDFVDSRR